MLRLEIHLQVLLEISDQLNRSKSQEGFGALVGHDGSEAGVVKACACFELIMDNNTIDQAFYVKRYAQTKSVLPDMYLVGFYHVGAGTFLVDSIKALFSHLVDQLDDRNLFFTKVTEDFTNVLPLTTKLISTWELIPTVICCSDSEYVATSTALNHQDYFCRKQDENKLRDSTVAEHAAALENTVAEYASKVTQLTEYKKGLPRKGLVTDSSHVDRLIRELEDKLDRVATDFHSGKPVQDNYERETMMLSQLTEQILAIDNLNYQISKAILLRGPASEFV